MADTWDGPTPRTRKVALEATAPVAAAPAWQERKPLFDITIVVGSVYEDADGTRSPFDVAVATIAEHARVNRPLYPGSNTYQFPDEDGEPIQVTINFTGPNPDRPRHGE